MLHNPLHYGEVNVFHTFQTEAYYHLKFHGKLDERSGGNVLHSVCNEFMTSWKFSVGTSFNKSGAFTGVPPYVPPITTLQQRNHKNMHRLRALSVFVARNRTRSVFTKSWKVFTRVLSPYYSRIHPTAANTFM